MVITISCIPNYWRNFCHQSENRTSLVFTIFCLKYSDFQVSNCNTISDGYYIFVRSEFELPSLLTLIIQCFWLAMFSYSTRRRLKLARNAHTYTASSSTTSWCSLIGPATNSNVLNLEAGKIYVIFSCATHRTVIFVLSFAFAVLRFSRSSQG